MFAEYKARLDRSWNYAVDADKIPIDSSKLNNTWIAPFEGQEGHVS